MERALKRYQKELKEGEEPALIAIANHVPFILLKSLSKNGTIKELDNTFFEWYETKEGYIWKREQYQSSGKIHWSEKYFLHNWFVNIFNLSDA